MALEIARAKINWAIRITGILENGYHELDMLMQETSLADRLFAEEAPGLDLRIEGCDIPADDTNLVLRAARALIERTGEPRGAKLLLRKRIPHQSGLGGGSADCAAALRLLRRLWGLAVSDEDLLAIGAKLGADVPFCLKGGLCRAGGVGEKLAALPKGEPIPLLIAKPDKGVSTPEAFRLWDEGVRGEREIDVERALRALENRDWDAMRLCAGNDLERAATKLVPEISEYLEALRKSGALYAAMTGSGSAVFGVYPTIGAAESAAGKIGIHATIAYAQ